MNLQEKLRLWNRFKMWVETTSLFDAIKEGTKRLNNSPLEYYTIESDSIIFSIKKGVVVNRVEDLPKDLLLNFLVNCPIGVIQENKYLIYNKISENGGNKQLPA